MTGIEMNWAAFALSIIRGYNPDTSRQVIEEGKLLGNKSRTDYMATQMIAAKETGLTWKEVGIRFDKNAGAAYHMVKRYKERNPQRRLDG